jgi:hypothetical protein
MIYKSLCKQLGIESIALDHLLQVEEAIANEDVVEVVGSDVQLPTRKDQLL